MTKLKYRFMAVISFVVIQSILFACASNTPTVAGKDAVEVWELEITGQTVGNLKMTLRRIQIERDIYSITGKIAGRIKDDQGGSGNAAYKLKGKIDKGVLTASLGGRSQMAAGPSSISGRMKGAVSGSLGSGTWRIAHENGYSAGKYTMKKIDSSK
jgi:hypothetical protein